jgi:hypothetical protein
MTRGVAWRRGIIVTQLSQKGIQGETSDPLTILYPYPNILLVRLLTLSFR